jgi:hypothetical protein
MSTRENGGANTVELAIPVDGATLTARLSRPSESPASALVALHGAERGLQDSPTLDGELSPAYERAMLDWLRRNAV